MVNLFTNFSLEWSKKGAGTAFLLGFIISVLKWGFVGALSFVTALGVLLIYGGLSMRYREGAVWSVSSFPVIFAGMYLSFFGMTTLVGLDNVFFSFIMMFILIWVYNRELKKLQIGEEKFPRLATYKEKNRYMQHLYNNRFDKVKGYEDMKTYKNVEAGKLKVYVVEKGVIQALSLGSFEILEKEKKKAKRKWGKRSLD